MATIPQFTHIRVLRAKINVKLSNKTIIAPLACCINYARRLRNSARASETLESEPSTETPPLSIEEHTQADEWLKAGEAIRLFGGKTKRSTFYSRAKSGLIQKRETRSGTYYLKSSIEECKRTNP